MCGAPRHLAPLMSPSAAMTEGLSGCTAGRSAMEAYFVPILSYCVFCVLMALVVGASVCFSFVVAIVVSSDDGFSKFVFTISMSALTRSLSYGVVVVPKRPGREGERRFDSGEVERG